MISKAKSAPPGASSRRVAIALSLVFGGAMTVLPVTTVSATPRATAASTPVGALVATLHDPAAATNDYFGVVAVSGTTAVVGDDSANSGAGAAYIYVKGTTRWPTTPTVTLHDPAATANGFGEAVAVSGSTIVVGAFGSNSNTGAAYIYVKGTADWPTTPTVTLQDPAATENDYFGYAVAVSGSTMVVSAVPLGIPPGSNSAAAYVYDEGTSGWPTAPTATLLDPIGLAADTFGWSVAISGTTVVVGASGTSSNAGAAYLYVKGTSDWPTKPTVTLQNPTPTATYLFGWSVAVSGTTAVIGAACSATCAATAFIYLKSGGRWQTTPVAGPHLPGSVGSQFGMSVAVSGSTVVAGACCTNTGEAYLYVKGTSGWPTTATATLVDPTPTANDYFGFVAVSGTTAAVGAPGTSPGGAAYIYKA